MGLLSKFKIVILWQILIDGRHDYGTYRSGIEVFRYDNWYQ